VIKTPATASAVNEIEIKNSATGNDVEVNATGGDTNISVKVKAKGTGKIKLGTAELQVPNTDGSVNQVLATNGSGVLAWQTPFGGSDVINESEIPTPQSDAVGKVVKLESDGRISGSFLRTSVVRTYLTAASPATWTKPAGLKYVIVEVQAAGGGGGSGGADPSGTGGGGGGGGYSKKKINAADLGATETVTIGTTGAGGASGGNNNGTAGGNTSFGAHATAVGGGGGGYGKTAGGTPGTAGTAASGDLNIAGSAGGRGSASAAIEVPYPAGTSFLSNGVTSPGTTTADGVAATGYGGGGSGGKTTSGAGGAGGNGSAGIVIVTEYYS
jgi:hypothetical protein